ncbi:MAG: pseudouridine synthase [Candidatus Auribacterota bacterium]|jgi:23S rRNA pseudouridine2605 synthase|nr:pseudouridine synthase [Candidatus Auribacterota bacterium]
MTLRLQKFLAQCAVGSRRSCEYLITNGAVSVNGNLTTKLGTVVDPDKDIVCVNGKPIQKQPLVYWLLNKPTGVVCSCKQDRKYQRVIDLIPDKDLRLYPAGRLDVESEGLVVITNDGHLCNIITHPKFGVTKEYDVWLDSSLSPEEQLKISRGITIDDSYVARPQIKDVIPVNSACKIRLELNEGRNREIRKMFAAINKTVLRLRRIRIGNIEIESLAYGDYRSLTPSEIEQLYRLGK